MNEESNKADIFKLLLSDIESDCSDIETSKDYLSSRGYNVESVISSGMKKIRQLEFRSAVNRTKAEMVHLTAYRQKAIEWVEGLLRDKNFSFPTFVKSEHLELSFRNIESLSETDIKDTLIEHFTLKFLEEESTDENKL
jgi:hypothetical protein